ncbi:MAG: CPBP family intramembrane glutamic endopeptidase [Planctomycetales bacterium]
MSESTAATSPGDDYWALARQPLHSLLFLLPLLGIYELGVHRLGASDEAFRSGADYWMRTALRQIGLEYSATLPLIVIVSLCAWHLAGRYRWKLSASTLIGMLAESLLLGSGLVLLGQLQDLAFHHATAENVPLAVTGFVAGAESIPDAVGYLGAGIYEEVLFRLCLLPIVYRLLRLVRLPGAGALAIAATSGLFSLAHYVGPAADPWALDSFSFRLVAGVVFAGLFLLRGFGVTVGAHAAYDLLVGVVLPTA